MFLNRLYYRFKPFLPRRLSISLRRWRALRILKNCKNNWPINEKSREKPDGWKSWPNKKKIAFVLTHDVESQRGVNQVKQLAELEMEMGFRSSFNFVPEGEYQVSVELREWLVENGFEVGVHDLHHDGRLYSSRKQFRKKAKRINHYLSQWKAVGFRSGFMLHQLEWLHDLDVTYDASTFDTDPFEPQPTGVNTIFPFLIQSGQSSYIELPYTLAQDSTLFLILKEQTIKIWQQKLDWLVHNQGMALVNIHPDYIDFSGGKTGNQTYPLSHIKELLQTVRDQYNGQYWNPLAKQLATWSRDSLFDTYQKAEAKEASSNILFGKRAAVVLYSTYPEDPRPRRAAQAMAEAGMKVDFICLRESKEKPQFEVDKGINIRRLSIPKTRGSKLSYLAQYGSFLLASLGILGWRSVRCKYDIIHVHNMPDILAFSGLIPKLFGAKIILDLHDPMPELMQSIYDLPEKSSFVRWLIHLEKSSIGFANLVLTPNKAFRDLFVSRGCPPEKIQIVMNSPQENTFQSSKYVVSPPSKKENRSFKLMHHGFIAERHGIDIALKAVALLNDKIPNVEFHLYGGETPFVPEVKALVDELGLTDRFHYHGFKTHPEIAEAISSMDLGLIPNRRSPFTEINLPTRIFEYIAMDKPVIVPDTVGIRDYFGDEDILFFEPDSPEDLANVIQWAYQNPQSVGSITARSKKIYESHSWASQKHKFLGYTAALLNS